MKRTPLEGIYGLVVIHKINIHITLSISMKFWRGLMASSLFILAQTPGIAMSIADYLKVKDDQGGKLYINGVGEGYMWANSTLVEGKQRPLFCQLAGIRPTSFQDVIEHELAAMRANGTYKESTTVELVLLYGLKDAFPCKY
jgi:hypothetical protein